MILAKSGQACFYGVYSTSECTAVSLMHDHAAAIAAASVAGPLATQQSRVLLEKMKAISMCWIIMKTLLDK